MKCSKCGREAIIYQRYSGLHLCESHFRADLEAKAKRAIRKHRWIVSGDTVAVALSGGKDSGALLHFLHTILKDRQDVRLAAITIDEGIRGYRDPARAEALACSRGVEWITASFREAFGITLDQVVRKTGVGRSCSYCGVMRRYLINRVAREHGATRLAFGFTLDDEAQSVLMNVLRGDTERLVRPMHPIEGLVPRIKPFVYVPEREVALYAFLNLEEFDLRGCPYSGSALRNDVRRMLDEYSFRHPATKNALVNLGEAVRQPGSGLQEAIRICGRCGEPAGEICRRCQILDELLPSGRAGAPGYPE